MELGSSIPFVLPDRTRTNDGYGLFICAWGQKHSEDSFLSYARGGDVVVQHKRQIIRELEPDGIVQMESFIIVIVY